MNILIIDDHPIVVDAYINCLSQRYLFSEKPAFSVAHSCKEAFFLINQLSHMYKYDLAIIDQSLPEYKEKNLLCGGDLALLIKKKNSTCKIIIVTAHIEFVPIYDLLKKVDPHGFIIKSDVDFGSFSAGVKLVLEGSKFHSVTVVSTIKEIWKKDLMVDESNRQILLYLYKGYKISALPLIVGLSVSSIKRRIAQMKDAFNTSEESGLVREALLQGFL
jgi:DNA-binding NarL/FixJ family response regulator